MRALICSALLATSSVAMSAQAQEAFLSVNEFSGSILADAKDAETLTARCNSYIAEARKRFDALKAETGPATVDGTLKTFDDIVAIISNGWGEFASYGQSMLLEEQRTAGQDCEVRFAELESEISLSREIYDRLVAIDRTGADAVTLFYLDRVIGEFDRAGVGLEPEQRAQVQVLKEEIAEIGTEFDANIAKARGTVKALPEELAGLPEDWIEAHPPGDDGLVEISTDTPDYSPVMSYAESNELRERLGRVYLARGYPENSTLLSRLFEKRRELAQLLGRPDYATLVLEDKMLSSPEQVAQLMAETAEAARPVALRDLARKQAVLDDLRPGETVHKFNNSWLTQQVLKRDYALDAQEVRQYFTYDNVRDGVFSLVEDLFAVDIRPWETPVWAPDVQAFEIYEGETLLGRFYLDSHPRDGKYKHGNHITLRRGVADESVAMSVLTMNMPKGGYYTGLMEHRDVETFLHEFGHLIHNILGSGHRWYGVNGVATERDFVEAPSQLLENWVYDYDTLAKFARNEAGEVIPRELVEKMNRARYFDRGMFEMTQLGYANASLQFHIEDLSGASAEQMSAAYRRFEGTYDPVGFPEGTHHEAAFGHLNGYSAIYYTYGWSRVISSDLFARFEQAGLRDVATAEDYRTMILKPGGSRPAAELVEDFLGRPVNSEAFKATIERDQ